VEAGSSAISGGKLAVHADVQIGDNDNAAMEVIQDASGKVIGLKMVDTHTGSCTSKDAQFNLYFDGTGGVTPVSTYWFGYYISRSSHYYDNLTQSTLASGSNGEYTLKDGVYTKLSGTDSGFAISWQDISLEANESKTFSFVLGVGEKADPPEWGSNGVYLTLNAQQTGKIIDVSAKVRDAAGLTDTLYYSVDGDDGIDLGDVSADGTVKTLAGQLDLAIYEPGTYSFSFWVVNSKGAASASVVREITINGDGSITGLDTEVPVTHTVTFDAQSGSAVDAITVDNGGTIATLPESTRNGFTFGGWYTEPGGVGALLTNETTITANITYYAKWTENTPAPVTYTVTVQNDGNGTATASPASAEAGTQIALTATPNDGYHFKEWQDLPVGVTVSDNKFTMPAADVTVRAIFEADVPTTYTVTYDANGGSGTVVDDTEYESGDAVTLKSGSGLTMDGYSFAGWNTEANGSGTPYSAGDTYTIADDTYFYAQWTQNEGEKDAAVDNTAAGSYAGTTVSGWGDLATKDETGNAYAPNVVVEVKLTVTAQTENSAPEAEVTAIKNAASGKTLQFLDLTLSKTVNGSPISDFGSRNNQVLEIKIPFTVGNKQNITVYRYHGSGASPFNPLNTRPASAWEDGKFYVDSINNAIYIYAKQFSTYAIGYTVPAPAPTPNPPIYVPVVHYCISKCDICGGCEDAKCTHSACKNKCLLLGMNFTDVAEGKWYTEPVAYVYHHGMMEGVGNNLFDINGTTTRAMIVTILWRLEGEPVVNYLTQFEDVAAETWYTEAVRWAASEKIVEGYSDTAFGPTEPITREQFATILWRYAKYKGYDVSVGEDTNILSYEDAFSVSEYAIPAMQWACGAGLMQGDGVNLTPKAEATRAQAAALFQRFCENVAEK